MQWRAVDSEGEVLEILIQPQRDNAAALRLLRKLFRRQAFVPTVIVTDKLRSYGAALRVIGFSGLHEQGLRANNRAENSHQLLRPHRVYCGWRCPRWTIAPEKIVHQLTATRERPAMRWVTASRPQQRVSKRENLATRAVVRRTRKISSLPSTKSG